MSSPPLRPFARSRVWAPTAKEAAAFDRDAIERRGVPPAARMVSDIEGRLATLEDRLGRNPEARLRLGITAVEHQSRLDAFLSEGGDA